MAKSKYKDTSRDKLAAAPIKNILFIPKIWFIICAAALFFCLWINIPDLARAQDAELEFNLDVNSNTTALPEIFKPAVDLSGRGWHNMDSWPQALAASEALDIWQKDIGFGGIYRVQYNLWEINEQAKADTLQGNLLANYESIIKKVNDAGGIIILNIFGTPAGLGKVLDKKSPSLDLNAFKELVKSHIRQLSCNKKYNIWYEVWNAPDLDDFFLGGTQEYLSMYRAVAEGIKELEAEAKIHIPVGGPAASWWFQACGNNTIMSPEKSLLYELIKYCYNYQLPLDFITWHTYSTDHKQEYEITGYNKTSLSLIRDWLTYFKFDVNTPLIIDEWNYDSGANFLPARQEKANICASFIPARIKNMHEAGLDYQIYFSLEDFHNNKEHVVRNTGIFWFDAEAQEFKAGPKPIYNVFRMLASLGKEKFVLPKANGDFIDIIATKKEGYIAVLIYNYIDPYMAKNYLSRNIASLNDSERKVLLSFIKSDKLGKIITSQINVNSLRVSKKLKSMLKKAQELNTEMNKFSSIDRKVRINIKNLKENYLYQRYAIDSSSGFNAEFIPVEENPASGAELFSVLLTMPPYSVQEIILAKKPQEEAAVIAVDSGQPQAAVSDKAGGAVDKNDKEIEGISAAALNQTKTEAPGNAGNIFTKTAEEETSIATISNQSQSEAEMGSNAESILKNSSLEEKAALGTGSLGPRSQVSNNTAN